MGAKRIRLGFVGSGGDGVMSIAALVMRTAAQRGIYGVQSQSYGPQIRGGEAAAFIQLSENPVYAEFFEKDLVICFNFAHADRFSREFGFGEGSVLIHEESDKVPMPEWMRNGARHIIPIPFKGILAESKLPPVAKNVFSFGIVSRLFGWDMQEAAKFIQVTFEKKGPDVINTNLKAFKQGYIYSENLKLPIDCKMKDGPRPLRSVIGNQASAEAAVAAGCRFFAGYPITPSSEVLNAFIKLLPLKNGKMIQAEDEISSMGMVIGASYGGVPAMTATSGPGLSLMTEMIGLASMVEVPVVILDCQRGGPSTGIPSKTEQSDLFHAVFGGHGDFPRVVLGATDVFDTWPSMFRAFYVAEKFHLPVIVLSDGYIGQRAENIPPEVDTGGFPQPKRIKLNSMPQEGVSLAELYPDIPEEVSLKVEPGTSGTYHHIAGIEQDDRGRPSATREVHEEMSRRRLSKIPAIKEETADWFEVIGNPEAEAAIVAWGSTRGAVYHFLEGKQNIKAFIPRIIHPFPLGGFENFLKGVKKLCFVELNFQGQLYQYLKTLMKLPAGTISLNPGGGSPISPRELNDFLKETPFKEGVSMSTEYLPDDYRNDYKPVWCPGCGDYGVLKAFTNAFSRLRLPTENIVMVSGIGCSSRIPGYFSTYGFNGIHGRALPISQGLKKARPDLTVLAVGGDGDGFAIGGGHILHAVRRNIDITYVVIDNNIYGLTKGQASPTSSIKLKKTKGLAGPDETPVNPMHVVFSYGAPFLARADSTDIDFLSNILYEAIRYPGFSFVHCLAGCVTYIGKNFRDFIKKNTSRLDERGHNPSDHEAALKIAYDEPYALGIVYRK